MTAQDRNSSGGSIDLDPAQQHMLSLPSPYHDNFSVPQITHDRPQAPPPKSSKAPNAFTSFFKRIRYTKVAQNLADVENGNEEVDNDDDAQDQQETETKPRATHWSEYEETPADRWFTVLFLLLLLSSLFNLFLIFNGPENGIPRHPKPKDDPLPHNGFRFKEHAKNYTCYQTHTTAFEANYEFSNTFNAYDHLWRELLGKSNGVIYTRLNRPDGEVRRAGLAMFHQLDCLAKIRAVVQGLQNGETDREDVKEHHGYWPYCFDYLRQVILCNADDSVETSRVDDGRWVMGGVESVKECRENKWLYEITECGERGCEGKAFYHTEEEMKRIHKEEEEAVEKWSKGHKAGSEA